MHQFLHDRPIESLDDDLLWTTTSVVHEQIQAIAETIASPLVSGLPSMGTLTFAVHGRWGMGKSSALRLIKSHATKEAGTATDRLFFCHYSAPANEALLRGTPLHGGAISVPTTLGLRMIQAIAGAPGEEQTRWLLENMNLLFRKKAEVTQDPDMVAPLRIFQEIASDLTGIIDFDKIVSQLLAGARPSEHKVLAVLIDDIDRCDANFVWALLNTIQQWAEIRNLYFILAVDRVKLRAAVKGGLAEGDEGEYALEKYVQHSVEVPVLEGDAVAGYLTALARSYPANRDILDVFADNSDVLRFGLAVQSPRSVKRCVNTLSLEVRRLAETGADESQRRRFLKEGMLRYSWPDFHREHFLSAVAAQTADGRGSQALHSFVALEASCRQFAADTDEARLRFELERIARQTGVDWQGIPLPLARFLGLKPAFFAAQPDAPPRFPTGILGRLQRQPDRRANSIPDRDPHTTPDVQQPLDHLQELYYEAAAAEADPTKLASAGRATLKLHEAHEAYFQTRPARVASIMGDIASVVASGDLLDVALPLWEAALKYQGEPRVQANNLQRFVGTVVVGELVDLYPVARECLKELSSPELRDQKPEVTDMLRAGLMMRGVANEGEEETPDAEVAADEIAAFCADPSNEMRFVTLAGLLTASKDADGLRRICKARYRAVESDEGRYSTLRSLADGLASIDSAAEESLELYYFILRTFDVGDETYAVQHNLAQVLYMQDYDDEAGKLWGEAYAAAPTDRTIRRQYAAYLARAKRADLASKVSRGEPVDERILQPSEKLLPKHFIPAEARWWES